MNASRLPSRRVYSSSILPQALFLDSASIQPVRSPSRLHPQWQPLSPDYTSFPLLLSRALAPPFLSYTQFTQNATTPSHRAAKPTPFLTALLHGPRSAMPATPVAPPTPPTTTTSTLPYDLSVLQEEGRYLVSVSRMNKYFQCPYAFYLQYVPPPTPAHA